MAGRIRTIKPEWLEDQRLLACSERARLLTVVLILIADDYGNGRGLPAYVKAQAGLYGASNEEAASALDELARAGFIELYEDNGQSYFSIRNWSKHQKVDKPGKPRVPSPPRVPRATAGDRRKVAYFIRGAATGLIKIGESVDPVSRLADLAACGSEVLELLAVGGVERDLHAELADSRVHGEWFRPTDAVMAKVREYSRGSSAPLATAGYANGKRVVDESPENLREDSANIRAVHATDHDQRPQTTNEDHRPKGAPRGLAIPDPVSDLWERQERHRATNPKLRPLKLTPSRRREVAGRVKDHGVEACEAVVDRYADEAERTGDWQYFDGVTNWRAANVDRAVGRLGTDPRAGPSPAGTANHRPLTGLAATAEILAERAAASAHFFDPFKPRGDQ